MPFFMTEDKGYVIWKEKFSPLTMGDLIENEGRTLNSAINSFNLFLENIKNGERVSLNDISRFENTSIMPNRIPLEKSRCFYSLLEVNEYDYKISGWFPNFPGSFLVRYVVPFNGSNYVSAFTRIACNKEDKDELEKLMLSFVPKID